MGGNLPGSSANEHQSWPTPNYTNPTGRHWLPPCASVLYAVATIAIAIRILVRLRHSATGGFGLDDFFLLTGWLAFTSLTVFVLLGATTYLMGRHMWDIPPEGWEEVAWTNFGAVHSFLATQCAIKTSVLLFYRRLGREAVFSKWWGYACVAAITFTAAWTVSCGFAIAFSCDPPNAYWRSYDPEYGQEYNCIDVTVVNWLAGILPVVSDLYSVALPCFLMFKLKLPPAQKVGVYVIFSVGWSVVTVSSVRTYYTHKIGAAADLSWTLYQNFLLSHLEICLGCLCATAPSLRIFYRVYMKRLPEQLKRILIDCIPYTIHIERRHPSSRVELSVRPGNRVIPEDDLIQYSISDMLRTPIIPEVDNVKRKDSVAGAVDISGTDSSASQARTPKQDWKGFWQESTSPIQQWQVSKAIQACPRINTIPEAPSSDDVDRLDNIILTEYNRTWLRDEETGQQSTTQHPP